MTNEQDLRSAFIQACVWHGPLEPAEAILATMLLRKADWHDTDGIAFLLERGADPNRMTRWHITRHFIKHCDATTISGTSS